MMISRIFTVPNAIRVMLLVGVFALAGVIIQSCQTPKTGLKRFAQASLSKLTVLESAPPRPTLRLKTLDGAAVKLSDMEVGITLVNVWATWCAPCIAEMPSLDALQAARGSDKFRVVPISLDRTPEDAKLWLEKNGITHLKSLHDKDYAMPGLAKLPGLPTSIFYDANGRELARIPGEVDWMSAEARALIDELTK
ncbi:MAG: TlpA family protein disulfide reductase [Maricaulaceae bacterium]